MSAPAGALPADLRIGFVGAGRLGRALAWSLHDAGLRVGYAASGTLEEARALAIRIPDCEAVEPQRVIDGCDLVFVTTPDGVIGSAAAQLRWRRGVAAVHCSGVTEVDVLEPARREGAMIGGFHPMQTFGDPDAAVASLPGSTVTIEAQEPLDGWLVGLAHRLGCRVNRLPPGMRGRYHAAAGFTSQFINVLFDQAAQVWASWGATEEDMVSAMLPMVRGTLASIESAGIAGGMPGPVSRGDAGSVDKHMKALADLGPEMTSFYRMMCGSTVALARRSGAIDDVMAQRIQSILREAG